MFWIHSAVRKRQVYPDKRLLTNPVACKKYQDGHLEELYIAHSHIFAMALALTEVIGISDKEWKK